MTLVIMLSIRTKMTRLAPSLLLILFEFVSLACNSIDPLPFLILCVFVGSLISVACTPGCKYTFASMHVTQSGRAVAGFPPTCLKWISRLTVVFEILPNK